MNWRRARSAFCFLQAAVAPAEPIVPYDGVYMPTSAQERVDRSFSDIPIEARFDAIQANLTEVRDGVCEQEGVCQWRGPDGVLYYFGADAPEQSYVTVKTVRAEDFHKRQIPALGIGLSREKAAVLAAAENFIPDADFKCITWNDNSGANRARRCWGPAG